MSKKGKSLSIRLSPELYNDIKDNVKQGNYNSISHLATESLKNLIYGNSNYCQPELLLQTTAAIESTLETINIYIPELNRHKNIKNLHERNEDLCKCFQKINLVNFHN